MSGSDAIDRQRRSLLEARDARAALIARHLQRLRLSGAGSLVAVGVNLPGPDKAPPGVPALMRRALGALRGAFPLAVSGAFGADSLGPFHLFLVPGVPTEIKRRAITIEETVEGGRLLDADVYDDAGVQVDRAAVGLAPRRCLACAESAADCIRLGRHERAAIDAAVGRLLGETDRSPGAVPPAQPGTRTPTCSPAELGRALVAGAMAELRLTPKPGLVDLADNGSHPDLSLDSMRRSIELLGDYLDELAASSREGSTLGEAVAIGQRAEARMFREVGANAHKGFIFLAGLLVVAASSGANSLDALRSSAAELARRLFSGRATGGGIASETTGGLASVFDVGLPAFTSALSRFSDGQLASHLLLARLMTVVEDTTAVKRCGPAGLARIRSDGARLEALIDRGGDHLAALASANADYRAMRLTMGGVADLVALTLGLFFLIEPGHPFSAADGPEPPPRGPR